MGDGIGLGSVCFCFSLNLHSAAQFVVYGPLMSLDDSLTLNWNRCHHPLPSLVCTVWLINVFSFYFREVPAELAFVLSKMENWEVVNAPDKHLGKMSGQVPMMPVAKKLPHDIDYFAFSKVANIYFKSHLWQMKREPIKTPFLPKQKESDFFESLAIFKLILRFMNDNSLGGIREKVVADYIANKGMHSEP